jgi:hypothetical protein
MPVMIYFKLNSAFTCAVTVTFWGVNSSVGAGAAAPGVMARAMCNGIGRAFSNVSIDA